MTHRDEIRPTLSLQWNRIVIGWEWWMKMLLSENKTTKKEIS